MPGRKVRRVSAVQLRRMFNEGRYYERLRAGEFVAYLTYDKHPCPEGAGEEYCTRSQLVKYVDLQEGRTVAEVHQYLRKDCAIGASGKPDPKSLIQGRTVYRVELED